MDTINKEYIATRLGTMGIAPSVLENYNQPHRYYHNLNHITAVLEHIAQKGELASDVLFLAAVFHDIIYNPRAIDNEEQSALYFREVYKGNEEIARKVEAIILDTKSHTASSPESEIFQQADLAVFDKPFDALIEYENQIFKEFQFADWKLYQTERVKVLQTFNANGKLDGLIAYVKTRIPNIGIYAGSFNPFHKGHYNILLKAEQIFDKVIIAFGKNLEKNHTQWPRPAQLQYRQVEEYGGLVTDFIQSLGYSTTLVRGLRNADDFKYEMKQYRYMQDFMPDVKMVSIFSDAEYDHISSSSIRILEKYNSHQRYLLGDE
jgi:pantetheine-phosphate adenylyltransferase